MGPGLFPLARFAPERRRDDETTGVIPCRRRAGGAAPKARDPVHSASCPRERFRATMRNLALPKLRGMAYRAKNPCVYILASRRNGTLYIGVTSDLNQRVALHKQDLIEGFTKKYRVHQLVYYEMHETMEAAIQREKRLKEWRRLWKIRLIESFNPEWADLFDEKTGEVFDGPADAARQNR
jgi:putative endonuclease